MNDVIDGKAKNKEAKKIVEQAEKNNLSKDDLNKTSGAVTNVINTVNEAYIEVLWLNNFLGVYY